MNEQEKTIRQCKGALVTMIIILLVVMLMSVIHACCAGANSVNFTLSLGSGVLAYILFLILDLIRKTEKNRS